MSLSQTFTTRTLGNGFLGKKDFVAPDFYRNHSGIIPGHIDAISISDIELPGMPGACDDAPVQFPLAERTAHVRTAIVDGVDLSFDIEQSDFCAVGDGNNDAFSWGNIFDISKFDGRSVQKPWSPPTTPEAFSAK